ncbi:MAG: hypothetical protein KKA22_01205 [Gammaproteobacteria bacterium]|nr:hypothetical protein [Gammaproteobacteria bacterium]MBU1406746.1 hypothetical protein [Gammaproteobacteria bacterium]MBU1533378.1 hypothetical protein [Gammaproteobacteria bacterium]
MSKFSDILVNHTKLQDRVTHSKELLKRVQTRLEKNTSCNRPELCIYAAGSLARHETGRISDLDLFFIGHSQNKDRRGRSISRLQEIEAFADLIRLNSELELQPFSGDGLYLKIHELDDLIDGTGSSDDDSENLFTTRLLLLLESKPIAGVSVYDHAVSQVLSMYFRDGRGRKDFRPLFLLNDILRYWRTLCLNYERDRFESGKPWWKRNLNLKFPRKLTVFSTVLAIIATRMTSAADFLPIATMTPMERMAFALDQIDDVSLISQYTSVLDDYEDFLAAKSHSELEGPTVPLEVFSEKAARLDDFLHNVFASERLDPRLVRYVLI